MHVFFSIIIPTYRRPELVCRAIDSVLTQSEVELELIVVNDSPDHDYSMVTQRYAGDARVRYSVNPENKGNNWSKNVALSQVSPLATHVLFLDDDDHVAPNVLRQLGAIVAENDPEWLVTNRAGLTHNKTQRTHIRYFSDYVLRKRFVGDATHCIKKDIAVRHRFADHVRNGEEIMYFLSIASEVPLFLYKDINTTISGGYLPDGLTHTDRASYRAHTFALIRDVHTWRQALYIVLRLVRGFFV